MGKIRALFSWLNDRRKEHLPVQVDRRKPRITGWKESSKTLDAAIDRLQSELKRHNSYERVEVANDIQQVVVFRTFAAICKYRNDALQIRLCRNPRHQDAANTALAICTEEKCPMMLEAISGGVAA